MKQGCKPKISVRWLSLLEESFQVDPKRQSPSLNWVKMNNTDKGRGWEPHTVKLELSKQGKDRGVLAAKMLMQRKT